MESAVHVYNPLHCNKGIGRRTGKIIEKKRNLKNGVDNFEDYLTSDDDMTLNETGAPAFRASKNLEDDSMFLKEKGDVLKLRALSDSKENVALPTKRTGSALEVSDEQTIAATLLTRNSKIGKRTGKVIEKKRNINNGVDNFEDYLSSDGEKSLDVTDASSGQSRESHDAVCLRSSKKMKDTPPSSQGLANSENDNLSQQSKSSAEALPDLKEMRLGTRNSRFGRRTGKDLLAGKELADLENFSNYLSDLNESNSILLSPPQVSRKSSKSAGIRSTKASHTLPRSNTSDLEMERNGNAPTQDTSENGSVNQKSDEENPIGGQSIKLRRSLEANHQDSEQSCGNKRGSFNRKGNTSKLETFLESSNQSENNSHSRKRSEKRSSLAVQAIRNSAKRKSLSEKYTDGDIKENCSHSRKDAFKKNLPVETEVKRSELDVSLSAADSEAMKQDDLNSSNNEGLDVDEQLITSYHEKVDESIYFKKSYEISDKRKSLVQDEEETELDGDKSLIETGNADGDINLDQSNNCSDQFSREVKMMKSTATSKCKSAKEDNAMLTDTEKSVSNESAKLSEGDIHEKNSNFVQSRDGASENQPNKKKSPVHSMSEIVQQNLEPDQESNEVQTLSKSYKQRKDKSIPNGGGKVITLEKEKTQDDSPHISHKKYAFNEAESDSDSEKVLNDMPVKSAKAKSKVESKDRKGRVKKGETAQPVCTMKISSDMNIESAKLISEAKNQSGHLVKSTRQGSVATTLKVISSKESSSDSQFITVSSKTMPDMSIHSSSTSSSDRSKKSARRMLDLSQGEDSDKANSDTEKAIKFSRDEIKQDEQKYSSLKRGRPRLSKTIENHNSKYSTSTSGEENDEPIVFMSFASKKTVPAILQHQTAVDEKSGKKVKDQRDDTDVSKDKKKINKKEAAVSSNIKDGLKKEKGKKRKITENVNDPDPNNVNISPESIKDNLKKSKKNFTPQAELNENQSEDALTSITSKPFISRELKDTPKTGDRQRFRNYRKKIFAGCIPEVIDYSHSEEVQDDEDEQVETKAVKAKKIQTKRNPITGVKKSKSQKLKDQRKVKNNPQKVIVKRKQETKPKHYQDEEIEPIEADEPRMNRVPMEVAITYTGKLKSTSGKKRGRPRKKSLEAGKLDGVPDPEESMCSPVSLRLIDSLPSVTPQSGVSFRKVRKQSFMHDDRHLQDGNDVDVDASHAKKLKSASGKKRGRPRKSSTASDKTNTHPGIVNAASDIDDNENNDVDIDASQTKKLNSVPGKKRGRPRKSSLASGNRKVTQSEKANVEFDIDGNESTCTPVSLKLIHALPNVTPRSGVSFRGRKSQSIMQDNNDTSPDPYEFSLQRHKKPDPESTPCSRSLNHANGLTSCLRDSSVPRPFKKGRKVRISNFVISGTPERTGGLLKAPDVTPTTALSLSSSPVHYAETTNSGAANTCQRSLLLPDLSHFIMRPGQKDLAGLRRSSRTRVKPVAAYKGERVIYRRDSTGYGLIVDAIQPSVGEAKIKANEEKRRKKRLKQKLKAMNVPVKANKRLSSHIHNLSLEMTQSESLPAVNPETQEEVVIEIVSRRSNVVWKGPELEPVQDSDHLAGCIQLQQPSFSSGEIQLRALGQKAYEKSMETLIFTVIIGKAVLTVNDKSTTVETGDDFCIPRGSAYGIKNLRRDVARFHFVCLHDNPQEDL